MQKRERREGTEREGYDQLINFICIDLLEAITQYS